MSLTSKTIATPNPAFRSLVAQVNESRFAALGGRVPIQGTTYKDPAFKTLFGSDYNPKFSNFTYLDQEGDTKDGGQLVFADPAQNTGLPFRITKKFGNHYWHPVLLKLEFLSVNGFPLSTSIGTSSTPSNANATRYVVREKYIPAATEGTLFIKQEFTSNVPFNIGKYPVPIASSVSYNFINIRGGFPECLHKKLIIPSLSGASSYIQGQIFPATNFETWIPYVISDEQVIQGGVWYRVRIIAIPPNFPTAVTKIS